MRYHYEKPTIYLSMYGKRYICDHPVYDSCTLFEIGDKGLAVIQQRYSNKSYRRLFYKLHDTEFAYTIPMDGNRAEDGIELRYRFGREQGYSSNSSILGQVHLAGRRQ